MTRPADTTVNVIPTLLYRDAPKAIDWLCEAFGFERGLVVPGESGTIAHAELRFGNGMLMLGSGGSHGGGPFDRRVQPPESADTVRPGSLYVIVEDPDAHCARARAAGARVIAEPEDAGYGGRGYTCCDLDGNVWTFGTFDPWAQAAPDGGAS